MNTTAMSNMTENTEVGPGTPIQINIAYAIVVPIIIVIGTVFNLTTILAFWKMPGLRDKPSDLLILNLSVVDLITG